MLHDLTRKRLEVAYAQNPPKVWLMMGHKAGDNSQVLALSTMCGHGMVSFNLAKKMLDMVREFFRQPEIISI